MFSGGPKGLKENIGSIWVKQSFFDQNILAIT